MRIFLVHYAASRNVLAQVRQLLPLPVLRAGRCFSLMFGPVTYYWSENDASHNQTLLLAANHQTSYLLPIFRPLKSGILGQCQTNIQWLIKRIDLTVSFKTPLLWAKPPTIKQCSDCAPCNSGDRSRSRAHCCARTRTNARHK